MIMAKNEIVAAQKHDHEFAKTNVWFDQVNVLQKKQQDWLFLMYWIPGTMLEFVRRGIFAR